MSNNIIQLCSRRTITTHHLGLWSAYIRANKWTCSRIIQWRFKFRIFIFDHVILFSSYTTQTSTTCSPPFERVFALDWKKHKCPIICCRVLNSRYRCRLIIEISQITFNNKCELAYDILRIKKSFIGNWHHTPDALHQYTHWRLHYIIHMVLSYRVCPTSDKNFSSN